MKSDEFNLSDWEDKFDRPQNLRVNGIYGPHDALTSLAIRDSASESVRFGKAVETDVFLLSTGPPENLARSLIGGVPYWPEQREWPRDRDGRFIPFLAQFDFRGSRDIVNAEGDILLVFADVTSPDRAYSLAWQSVDTKIKLIEPQAVPVSNNLPCYFGTKWRICNFPDYTNLDKNSGASTIRLKDGSRVREAYFAFTLMGMQIGDSPFIAPGLEDDLDQMTIVCSLCGIAPFMGVEYPFVNRKAPLDAIDQKAAQIPLSYVNEGLGIYYIVRKGGKLMLIHHEL